MQSNLIPKDVEPRLIDAGSNNELPRQRSDHTNTIIPTTVSVYCQRKQIRRESIASIFLMAERCQRQWPCKHYQVKYVYFNHIWHIFKVVDYLGGFVETSRRKELAIWFRCPLSSKTAFIWAVTQKPSKFSLHENQLAKACRVHRATLQNWMSQWHICKAAVWPGESYYSNMVI